MLKKLLNNKEVKKYGFNSLWMLLELVGRIVAGFVVSVYIAKHLGPDGFGVLSFALAVFTLLSSVARLGLEGVLVRELIKDSSACKEIMGTAFWSTTILAVFCYAFLVVSVLFSSEQEDVKRALLVIGLGGMFVSFQVIDYYFQSQVRAKIPVMAKTTTLILMSSIKIVLVYKGAKLECFAWAYFSDCVMLSLFLFALFYKNASFSFYQSFSVARLLALLKSSMPILLGGIAIQIYMRSDQIMIRYMLGIEEVGLYSAAIRIYEAWAVAISVFTVSLLPAIMKAKAMGEVLYHEKICQLLRLIFIGGVCVAAIVSFANNFIVISLFGNEYERSADVLQLIVWAGVFSGYGAVSARYFVVEGKEAKFAMRSILAAALNIGLNFLLIPLFGMKGAAISTLVCLAFSNYAVDYFDPSLKELLKAKNKAVVGKLFDKVVMR